MELVDYDTMIGMLERAGIPFKVQQSSYEKYIDIEAGVGNVSGYTDYSARFCFKMNGKLDRIWLGE